jgi:hypothetical protein
LFLLRFDLVAVWSFWEVPIAEALGFGLSIKILMMTMGNISHEDDNDDRRH